MAAAACVSCGDRESDARTIEVRDKYGEYVRSVGPYCSECVSDDVLGTEDVEGWVE